MRQTNFPINDYNCIYNKSTCNPISLLPDTNVYAKFEKIGQKVLELEHGNEALMDGVVSEWNYPTCNPISLVSDTNVCAMHM